MDVIETLIKQKKIKILLVFFCFITVVGCSEKGAIEPIYVYDESNRVIGIQFNAHDDVHQFKVVLKGQTTAILGEFTASNTSLTTFKPIIPFSAGESYELHKDANRIAQFSIPELHIDTRPTLEHIYPTSDKVPENLLKMYFVFSEPIQEVGNILDYISIINIDENVQKDVFLKLESELWNKEHTTLTLWLDPGRIKTDLIPNKEKGLPIINGNSYSLTVKKELKSAKGIMMSSDHVKNFEVTTRDDQKPSISQWKLNLPIKNTVQELSINLNETLDALLLLETISVYYKDQKIKGEFSLSNTETSLHFRPHQSWQAGAYKIIVSSILEDLAGNNLNRLFDNDVHTESNESVESSYKSISFQIE